MNYKKIKEILKAHNCLIFKYKSKYYSIRKIRRIFFTKYLLMDTDNLPQQYNSLSELYANACMHDGAHFSDVELIIEICDGEDYINDLSFEAIRHDAVIYGKEIHFCYKNIGYWIAQTPNGIWHLTDEFGNSQEFYSCNHLFFDARIDNKSLKEIWDELDIDTC